MDTKFLKKLSDDDLVQLAEAVITAVNVRFFLCGLTENCEFNIHITPPTREEQT